MAKETNKREVSLYGGDVTIVFYPDSHRYKKKGERTYLISSTAATGIVDKSRVLIKWAVGLVTAHLRQSIDGISELATSELHLIIDEAEKQPDLKRDQAAEAGTMVHNFAEQFALAKLGKAEMPKIPTDLPNEMQEKVKNGINAFLDWYLSNNVTFHHTEKLVYSKKYEHVGTLDVLVEINNLLYVTDYKTSKGLYSDQRYQVASYKSAFNEEMEHIGGRKADKSLILNFSKETGELKVIEISDEEHKKDYEAFLCCLGLKKREKELNRY